MKTTDYLILLVCRYNTGFANCNSSRTVRDTFHTSFQDEIETSIDNSFRDITKRMSILATDVPRDREGETEAIVLRRQKDARKKVLDAVWNGADGKHGFRCFSETVRFDADPSYDPYECGIAGIPESLDVYVSAENSLCKEDCGKYEENEKNDSDGQPTPPSVPKPTADKVVDSTVRLLKALVDRVIEKTPHESANRMADEAVDAISSTVGKALDILSKDTPQGLKPPKPMFATLICSSLALSSASCHFSRKALADENRQYAENEAKPLFSRYTVLAIASSIASLSLGIAAFFAD